MSYERWASGPLQALVVVDDSDGDFHAELDDVMGGDDPEPGSKKMTNRDWLREFVSDCGADYVFFDRDVPQKAGMYLFEGSMFGSKVESYDYGTDYDEEFEITKVWEVTSMTPILTKYSKPNQLTKLEGWSYGLREVKP